MLYEMLIYHCMQKEIEQFKAKIQAFWEAYGISQVSSWTVTLGDFSRELYYVLLWESLGERQEKWTQMDSNSNWKPIGTSFMSIINTKPERLFRAI